MVNTELIELCWGLGNEICRPEPERVLSAQVWAAIESADLVAHAGDWIETGLLDQMQARAAHLVGVWGNNDPVKLRKRGCEARSDDLFPDAEVLVFGHSHIPWDSVTPVEMRLLNPGSPTDRRRMPTCTYLTAVAEAGVLRDVRVVDTNDDSTRWRLGRV
ncbi:YfcE family phosphodiesterase [Cryobacterium sp. PH31-AA6]|uniref:metallophosphoesterase family protein n=1 Tax=Cryobacterium sp. PH31-AA6 TaxID=3046205 RepID=UPI0024BB0892|nr:YfcE family phosphodiesterase [Cryobacterium sp. PH31-AA6]MDJ0325513.1 YfcE family phosphodiesterase [Cryobacterium sp. PH31-AA6]